MTLFKATISFATVLFIFLETHALPSDEVTNLVKDLRLFAEDSINSEIGLSNSTCSKLNGYNVSLSRLNKGSFEKAFFTQDGPRLVEQLFAARLAVRQRMIEMAETSKIGPKCIRSIRDLFRTLRFIEEYVAEQSIGNEKLSPLVFAGKKPYFMGNPKFDDHGLKSGDILLSRGNAVVSAAIARIGDDDGQFSHIALVYKDELSQEWFTIEAHIEIGVVVAPLQKYLSDGKVRSVIYRHSDQALAHEAAKIMFNKVSQASQSRRGNIPYDFGMDLSNDQEIFCSEVASLGYQLASEKLYRTPMNIPLYKTTINMRNRQFLNAIGVLVKETFAPTDIDVDPRFELVAEWRNLSKTEEARFLDAILSSMYEWMEVRNYVFDNTLLDILAATTGWTARKTFLFSPLLKDKFPRNMQLSALNAMISLGDVGSALLQMIKDTNQVVIKQSGLSMTYFEIKTLLENVRDRDFKVYKKIIPDGKRPLFHSRFHPIEK